MRREGGGGPVRRVLGYARVSSVEQTRGTSLQDQQNSIAAFAKTRGLAVAKFYVESESGIHEKIERREQMRLLQKDVRAGDLIVCDKLDRWSRDPEFTHRSVREILEAGASFYAVSDRCDPSTRDGDTMLGFRILFAHEEHKRIVERLVGTRQLLRDQGYYIEGLPPVGYLRKHGRGHKGIEKNELLIDEVGAEIVLEIYRLCVRGSSVGDIVGHLTVTRKHRKWDKKMVNHALRNRLYLGEIKDTQGLWIRGKHPAIIEPALFDRAQAALDGRRLSGAKPKSSSRTESWLLRQVAQCARCHSKIGAAYGGRTERYPEYYKFYYVCQKRCAGSRYMRVDEFDKQVAAMMLARLTDLRADLSRGDEVTEVVPVVDFAARKAQLERRRERYLEEYADELITREKLRASIGKIDTERTKVEALEAEQAKASPLRAKEVRREILAKVQVLFEGWRKTATPGRRAILEELASEVLIEYGHTPRIRWRTPDEIASNFTS